MFVDYSASTVYTLAFLACGHYSASILHSVPEANKIQQKLSRDFHVDLTPRDMAVKQTKSCETSSSSLIQANKYNMPINNWRSMKQISFLFSRVDGSLDLDAGQGIQCLGHLWLLGFLGGFIPSTSYDWYELFMFSPLVHWSPKMLRLWPHAMLLFFFFFLRPDVFLLFLNLTISMDFRWGSGGNSDEPDGSVTDMCEHHLNMISSKMPYIGLTRKYV